MSEAVSIISVSVSGVVAAGGLISAGWGASRERRWKSREERTIDVRVVLEDVADAFGKAMFAAGRAWEDLAKRGRLSDANLAVLEETWLSFIGAGNRLGVRLGSKSAEYAAYRECMTKLATMRTIVAETANSSLGDERERGFYRAQSLAVEAETAYLDAAAQRLSPDG